MILDTSILKYFSTLSCCPFCRQAQESQGPGRASRRAKAERDAEDPEVEVSLDQLGLRCVASVVSVNWRKT